MYLLDLSGYDENGTPGVKRFGGRFVSVEDAETHGRRAAHEGRFVFRPSALWVRDEENEVVRQLRLNDAGNAVTIKSEGGQEDTFACGGATDQEALIYAGKVVEGKAGSVEPSASVKITKDGRPIGPAATVREMTKRAV